MQLSTDINRRFIETLMLIAVLMLAAIVGLGSAFGIFTIKDSIIVAAGILTLALLVKDDATRWTLLCIGVVSTAFGHRGIYLGYWTYLVPLEVIIWLIWLILTCRMVLVKTFTAPIPKLLLFTLVWAVMRSLVSLLEGDDWDTMLAWTLPLLAALPTFSVVGYFVRRPAQLKTILNIFVAVTALISVLGIIEYLYPSVTLLFPWFFTQSSFVAQDGFVRAAFSFWGYPAVASVIVWGVLIAYHEILMGCTGRRALILSAVLTVGIIAIYISGERLGWIGLFIGLVVLSLRKLGFLFGILIVIGVVLVLANLSTGEFHNRLLTIINLANGVVSDTSTQARIDRWQWGIDAITSSPILGVGYGHLLTHDSVLEIGSTIGVLPALAFIGFVGTLMLRIVKTALNGVNQNARSDGLLFIALSVTWILLLAAETALQTPPFSAPLWLMMALGWYLSDVHAAREDQLVIINAPVLFELQPGR